VRQRSAQQATFTSVFSVTQVDNTESKRAVFCTRRGSALRDRPAQPTEGACGRPAGSAMSGEGGFSFPALKPAKLPDQARDAGEAQRPRWLHMWS
jgi:hypothetical protein